MDFDFSYCKNDVLAKECLSYILNLEIQRSNRHLYFFSLVMILPDIVLESEDTNKDFHQPLVNIIKQSIRDTDVVTKISKNDYYVILHQSDMQNHKIVCDRIKNRVKNYDFMLDNNKKNITVSGGVACVPSDCNDLPALLRICEQRLQSARDNGGDCFFSE